MSCMRYSEAIYSSSVIGSASGRKSIQHPLEDMTHFLSLIDLEDREMSDSEVIILPHGITIISPGPLVNLIMSVWGNNFPH